MNAEAHVLASFFSPSLVMVTAFKIFAYFMGNEGNALHRRGFPPI